MARVPHLLLAAGDSRRMGQPKQLLPWGNRTLIEHRINILLQTGQDVAVVLGGHCDRILPVIEKLPLGIFINKEWTRGMGSSLAYGIKMLQKKKLAVDGVLISLVDQPLVSITHFENMLALFQPGYNQIIISQSASGWKGVPVLFDAFYFDELKNLDGAEGARKIIQNHAYAVKSLECGDQLEDIDTPETYQKLLQKFKS